MLNEQERIDVVKYRIENALRTLDEVKEFFINIWTSFPTAKIQQKFGMTNYFL